MVRKALGNMSLNDWLGKDFLRTPEEAAREVWKLHAGVEVNITAPDEPS